MLPDAVERVARAFAGWDRAWGIAGGWALDAWRGVVSREHHDVDVAVLRDDQHALRVIGGDWQWIEGGVAHPWHGEPLALPIHELVAPGLEVLLNERDGDDWVYRRDARIRRPLARAFLETAWGIPVLAPEIVLLYKSKRPRAVDEADFAASAGGLAADARAWLAAALGREHPWHAALA
ncbi:MAG TPA: hypothetical protein VLT45_03920 [Kofleriaceae bacterium]|nr:hypothetical protein [Kofleriaceae bacterium]